MESDGSGRRAGLPRREFVLLAAVVGLGALVSPWALPRVLRRFGVPMGPYRGPLIARVEELTDRLVRGAIGPDALLAELRQRFQEMDPAEELGEWIARGPEQDGMRLLREWRHREHGQVLRLAFVPQGHAAPPHAHHDLLSAQCVLTGSLRVRQFERAARLDPATLALRPASDREFHPFDTILASEFLDNVHWFGAEQEPSVVLQYNLVGGLQTFEPASHALGRYYLDPTGSGREGGLIVAPEIGQEEAMARFAARRLSEFPSPLRA